MFPQRQNIFYIKAKTVSTTRLKYMDIIENIPSDFYSPIKGITAGTMETLGETTHSLCCNARPTGPLKS